MPFINLANSREKENENRCNARTPFALWNDNRCILRCALFFSQHFTTISAFYGIHLDGFSTIGTRFCFVAHFLTSISVRYYLINIDKMDFTVIFNAFEPVFRACLNSIQIDFQEFEVLAKYKIS